MILWFSETTKIQVRRIGIIRLSTLAFNRAYGCFGHPIWVVYLTEQVVIGTANHAYVWVAFAKEHCTAMVLRISSPMLQRGSRKCGTLGAWFSEPPNKELERCRQPYSHGPWPERVRSAAGAFPFFGGRSEARVRSKWGSLFVANRLPRRRISVFLLLSRRKPSAHPCQPPGW